MSMALFDDHPGDERHVRNEVRISNPQPGDYWHEMFCPYFVVVAVEGDQVLICDTKRDLDRDHWTFDLKQCRYFSRAELRKKVTYDTMPNQFVADCSQKPHLWVVDDYAELTREATFADLYA